jgi:hypothetical protein
MVGIQKTKNEEQEWNPAFARLTKAAGTLRQAQEPNASATKINTAPRIITNKGICITVAHASGLVFRAFHCPAVTTLILQFKYPMNRR